MAKHIHIKEVTSTNDVAFEFAKKGAEHLTCVSADVQTKGRGRRGRVWSTVPHKSVAASFILKGYSGDFLPYAMSLAVLGTVQEFVPTAQIKWPNDILINGQKTSGILIEKHGQGESSFYIIGVGINVNRFEDAFFDESIGATSLEHYTTQKLESSDVLQHLQGYVAKWVEKNNVEVLKAYRKNCATIGSHVTWESDKQTLTGLAKHITDEGSLGIELDSGKIKEVLSGDIVSQK